MTQSQVKFDSSVPPDKTDGGPILLTLIIDTLILPSKQLLTILEKCSIDYKKFKQDQWYFGVTSYTFELSTSKENALQSAILNLKHLQLNSNHTFWISTNQAKQSLSIPRTYPSCKNVKLGKYYMNCGISLDYSCGSLISMNKYYTYARLQNTWRITFYSDKFDIDYGLKDDRKRIVVKADFLDRCAIVTTLNDGFILHLMMKGNTQDQITDPASDASSLPRYVRTCSLSSKPCCSTIRLLVKLDSPKSPSDDDDGNNNSQHNLNRINSCFQRYLTFLQQNQIQLCFGLISSSLAGQVTNICQIKPSFNSFIKNYCWEMLLSIGHRFEQRLEQRFIILMEKIKDDDEFFQTSLHLWRRATEYHFLSLYDELIRYQKHIGELELGQPQWSLSYPPKNYCYVPSITVTPSTIIYKPFKLCKTNRVLREKKFGGQMSFALVDIKEENGMDLYPHDYRSLRFKLEYLLTNGFEITQNRIYKYLHHSQSQLKDKQFWFYNYQEGYNLSFEDAYKWMGDFDGERVVAKHSARIAQCFTSAEATIQIPSSLVEYVDDIETSDGKYNFTDGIQPNRPFSAVQIRYGGCKGIISVKPELDNCVHQLAIRNSMLKFKSNHDILELCRISKPRSLYLNRQAIVLLSHRGIDDANFLLLQNEHHLCLIESLLYPSSAFELLCDKIIRNLFPFRQLVLDGQINFILEPFFRQLIITICKYDLKQMKEKSRTKIAKTKARNMIGIVDEYGILEYGQVFIQFSNMKQESLTGDGDENDEETTTILKQRVVVTKNPCHHPGDARTFQAVDSEKLRHLKDVIVFPQKGRRPHPNEISGSDLDGDEYAVYWHEDLVPTTDNIEPYDYDSQDQPEKLDRPITRDDINKVVLDISEQNCLGKLCSLHLAYVDKYGVDHEKCIEIAGAISEEVDAGKTGKHPYTLQKLKELNSHLNNERPDYIDNKHYSHYPSKHVLGKLFRSTSRFEPNWSKLASTPCHSVDPLLIHDNYRAYGNSARDLFRRYRDSILDILYVYHFSSDIDLICRFDSSQPTKRDGNNNLIADSAQTELRLLIQRTRTLFYEEFQGNCECPQCLEPKLAKVSACYMICYQQQQQQDLSKKKKIISFPWLFAQLLIKLRQINIQKQTKLLSHTVAADILEVQHYKLTGEALKRSLQYLHDNVQLKLSVSFNDKDIQIRLGTKKRSKHLCTYRRLTLLEVCFIEIINHWLYDQQQVFVKDQQQSLPTDKIPLLQEETWQHTLTKFVMQQNSPNDCGDGNETTCSQMIVQQSDGIQKDVYYDKVRQLLDQKWSDNDEYRKLALMLKQLLRITSQCAKIHRNEMNRSEEFTYLNEYLILALQQIATDNELLK